MRLWTFLKEEQEKQAGFSSLAQEVYVDQRIWGAHADVDLTERVGLEFTYDDYEDGDGQIKRDGTGSVSWQLDEYWKVTFGLRLSLVPDTTLT